MSPQSLLLSICPSQPMALTTSSHIHNACVAFLLVAMVFLCSRCGPFVSHGYRYRILHGMASNRTCMEYELLRSFIRSQRCYFGTNRTTAGTGDTNSTLCPIAMSFSIERLRAKNVVRVVCRYTHPVDRIPFRVIDKSIHQNLQVRSIT